MGPKKEKIFKKLKNFSFKYTDLISVHNEHWAANLPLTMIELLVNSNSNVLCTLFRFQILNVRQHLRMKVFAEVDVVVPERLQRLLTVDGDVIGS